MLVRLSVACVLLLSVSTLRAQSLFDPSLRVQTYLKGLDAPTGAVFLNNRGDLLVTQKNDGRVMLVRDRKVVGAALDLPVANNSERGLLSIALSPNFASDRFVYLYHTAAATDGGEAISNKVSRYRLEGDQLVFNRKIIDLPPGPGPNHNGGKIAFDNKGKLYVVVGDLNRQERTQNFNESPTITTSGAILRLSANGKPVPTNPFHPGKYFNNGTIQGGSGTMTIFWPPPPPRPLGDIYAYGIRNSFGIAFDPVTGDLWNTENGSDKFDEINRVRPGFNSGWASIMGPRHLNEATTLVNLGPAAHYTDPKLSWAKPVAPTDLHFYEGLKLGEEYQNDLFVGDANTGSLYHFDLISTRKSLRLTGQLSDYIVNNDSNLLDEMADIRLGEGFGVITDILSGPGGLFVLSMNGRLYRIQQDPTIGRMSAFATGLDEGWLTLVPEPVGAGAAAPAMVMLGLGRRRGTIRGRGRYGTYLV